MPDPDPREISRKRWDWPGWLIAYVVTLLVLRDILLAIVE